MKFEQLRSPQENIRRPSLWSEKNTRIARSSKISTIFFFKISANRMKTEVIRKHLLWYDFILLLDLKATSEFFTVFFLISIIENGQRYKVWISSSNWLLLMIVAALTVAQVVTHWSYSASVSWCIGLMMHLSRDVSVSWCICLVMHLLWEAGSWWSCLLSPVRTVFLLTIDSISESLSWLRIDSFSSVMLTH